MRKELLPERVTAILRGYDGEKLDKIVKALVSGGIKAIEITMNSPNAADSIKRLRTSYDERLLIGAGTVTTLERFHLAAEAGAQFIITPNVDESIIKASHKKGLMIMPGALTPTEIERAFSLGCRYIKLFPASLMGPQYIKAVKAPLDDAKIIAVGGIDLENAEDYIQCGAYGVGIGDCLCRTPEDGDYAKIIQGAEKLVNMVYSSGGNT